MLYVQSIVSVPHRWKILQCDCASCFHSVCSLVFRWRKYCGAQLRRCVTHCIQLFNLMRTSETGKFSKPWLLNHWIICLKNEWLFSWHQSRFFGIKLSFLSLKKPFLSPIQRNVNSYGKECISFFLLNNVVWFSTLLFIIGNVWSKW